jgi:hypothetical protein
MRETIRIFVAVRGEFLVAVITNATGGHQSVTATVQVSFVVKAV